MSLVEHKGIDGLVAERVRRAIGDAGLSQRQTARLAKIPTSTFSKKVRGRSSFTVIDIARIAEALNVDILDLLPRSEQDAA